MTLPTTHTTHTQRGALPVFYQPTTSHAYGFYYCVFNSPKHGRRHIKGNTPREAAAQLLAHVSTNRFLRSRHEELPLSVGDKLAWDAMPAHGAAAYQVMLPA